MGDDQFAKLPHRGSFLYTNVMEDSIFTKIIKGDIHGEVIYQDEKCFVLLTIQPFTDGHMLVIPREHIDHLWDLDADTYHHLFDVTKIMKEKLNRAYPEYVRVGIVVEGFGVPHAHVHVFGYTQPLEATVVDRYEKKQKNGDRFETDESLKMVADKLRAV